MSGQVLKREKGYVWRKGAFVSGGVKGWQTWEDTVCVCVCVPARASLCRCVCMCVHLCIECVCMCGSLCRGVCVCVAWGRMTGGHLEGTCSDRCDRCQGQWSQGGGEP